VASALVICGSDKRGTIYGIYDLSEQIGFRRGITGPMCRPGIRMPLFVQAGEFVQGPPSVKYRGIFLNDEAPDLSNWIQAKYGARPASVARPITVRPFTPICLS
jgi:hypothetical protein